jgi:hypothetical protein
MVCGDVEERRPLLPVQHTRLHWSLPAPAKAAGADEQISSIFRAVRSDVQEARARQDLRVALRKKRWQSSSVLSAKRLC